MILDTRSKIIIAVGTIFFIAFLNQGSYIYYGTFFALSLIIAILFRANILKVFIRTIKLFVIPFAISIFIPFAHKGNALLSFKLLSYTITISDSGLEIFFMVLMKSFLSLFLLSSLIVSTKELDLFFGLRKLKIPKIFVMIIYLMYRYIFLFREEFKTGERAIKARIFRRSSFFALNKNLGYLIGNMFIKSFTRAENVYKAMLARGFEGEFNFSDNSSLSIKTYDFLFISLIAAFNIIILIFKFYGPYFI